MLRQVRLFLTLFAVCFALLGGFLSFVYPLQLGFVFLHFALALALLRGHVVCHLVGGWSAAGDRYLSHTALLADHGS